MASFNQFIESFSNNPNKKGDQFEYFVKKFLKHDPYWKSKVKTVWPFKEAPINWGTDIGTDLIFEDYDGKYWAVQAKKYDSEHSVTKDDVNSFLSDSNRPNIHKRLLIISTNKIAKNGLKTINDQEKKVVVFRLQDFEVRGDIYPDNLSDLLNFKLQEPPKPRPHQEEAIKDVVEGFKKSNKGQLIMACGTGKTYTYFWIHKDLKSNKTLVLVPSLNLLSQTLQEWIKANGSSFRSLCVCSDPTTVKNVQEDEIILEQSDLPYTVSWDVDEITNFLKRPEPTIIFSTYQSSDLIAEAQKKVPNHIFDLSIADEAHRCTGKTDSDFTIILDDQRIRSQKKLFGTATPKLYKSYMKKAAKEKDTEVIDMNDKGKFGDVLHILSFGKAIKQNLLADYQVIVVGVNDARVKEMIDQKEFISIKENHKSDAMSLATQVGFIKAIKDNNLSRLVTFHGRVKKASDFSKSLPEIFEWTKSEYKGNKELEIDYVSGKMQTNERRRKLNDLKNSESNQISILSNARCLSEGIDVPHMDGIAFINPKSSEIDIVQSIGRAIRKPDDSKSIGYIILPVFIDNKNTVEESIETSNFEPVWKVMNALKSHDEDFKIELDNLRMKLGKTGITGRPSKFVFDLPTKITSRFQEKVETHLIQKVTDSWYYFFGILKKYYEEHKTSQCTHKEVYRGVNIGGWIGRQRKLYKEKKISKERIKKLHKNFHDWSWNPDQDNWIRYFKTLKEYYLEFKTSRVPKSKIYKSLKLGLWLSTQRVKYNRDQSHIRSSLSMEKIDLFQKTFPDWSWDPYEDIWLENYQTLKDYYSEYKTSWVPNKTIFKNFNLGVWVDNQRSAYREKVLSKERIDKLQTFSDWSWDTEEDIWQKKFKILKEYYAEFGNTKVTKDIIYKDFKLGQWINNIRSSYRRKSLTKERSKLFQQTFSDWFWNPDQGIWFQQFNALKEYYEEFRSSWVPKNKIYKGLNLGSWVARQRINYNLEEKTGRKKLSKERISLLEKAFTDWSWNPDKDIWLRYFKILKEYYAEFGNTRITGDFIYKNLKLGQWVGTQRYLYNKKIKLSNKRNLSKERIDKLQKAFPDWSWNLLDDIWLENFKALQEYYLENKSSWVSRKVIYKGIRLGLWHDRQRQEYRKNKLSENKIKKLETFPDWSWR